MKKLFMHLITSLFLLLLSSQIFAYQMMIYPPGATPSGQPLSFDLIYCGTISGAPCSASVQTALKNTLNNIPYNNPYPVAVFIDPSISELTIGNLAIDSEPERYCQYYVVGGADIPSIDGALVTVGQQGFQCYVGRQNASRFYFSSNNAK